MKNGYFKQLSPTKFEQEFWSVRYTREFGWGYYYWGRFETRQDVLFAMRQQGFGSDAIPTQHVWTSENGRWFS